MRTAHTDNEKGEGTGEFGISSKKNPAKSMKGGGERLSSSEGYHKWRVAKQLR